MEFSEKREITTLDSVDDYIECGRVIGMRHEIAVGQHIDPRIAVLNEFGLKSLAYDLSRSHRR